MRRTIEARRDDVMHYRGGECKVRNVGSLGFFGRCSPLPIVLRVQGAKVGCLRLPRSVNRRRWGRTSRSSSALHQRTPPAGTTDWWDWDYVPRNDLGWDWCDRGALRAAPILGGAPLSIKSPGTGRLLWRSAELGLLRAGSLHNTTTHSRQITRRLQPFTLGCKWKNFICFKR